MKVKFIILSLIVSAAYGQSFTVNNKQLLHNGSHFTPLVLNYQVELAIQGTNISGCYLTPFVEYDNQWTTALPPINKMGLFECHNSQDCENQIKDHFQYISSLGFNTLRIGLYPKSHPEYMQGMSILTRTDLINDVCCFQYLPINTSDVTDPAFLLLVNSFKKLMKLAANNINPINNQSHPLYLILNLNGDANSYDSFTISKYNDWMLNIASALRNDLNHHVLLAYDMWNEPAYHDLAWPFKSKEQACKIIRDFYNQLKLGDPNTLVTIGSAGAADQLHYDPNNLKVDFVSFHTYPTFHAYEDRTDPNIQLRALKRVINTFNWYNKITPVPWLMGETGFTASNTVSLPQFCSGCSMGSVSDQQYFATSSLAEVFNCGGIGYSWWNFQDGAWFPDNDYGLRHFGLLEFGFTPGTGGVKPAALIFSNGIPSLGSCGSDYTPYFDISKVYYDPFNHKYLNSSELGAVEGWLKDQNGTGIPDAELIALNFLGMRDDDNDPWTPMVPYGYWTNTITDLNGYCKFIPYNYETNPIHKITYINLRGCGIASNDEIGDRSSDLPIVGSTTSILSFNRFNDNLNLSNLFINSNDIKVFKAYSNVNLEHSIIEGYLSCRTRHSIDINVDVDIKVGSESVLEIDETFSDCAEMILPLRTSYSSEVYNSGMSEETDESKEIQLTLKAEDNLFQLKTNPVLRSFELTSNDKKLNINSLTLYSTSGLKLYQWENINLNIPLNIDILNSGVYLLEVNSGSKYQYLKLIKL